MASINYGIIEAPSNLGLRPSGVEGLSQALLSIGLMDALHAHYEGRLEVPKFNPYFDPDSGIVNEGTIRAFSCDLAKMVERTMVMGRVPVVLGGDCSILLGPMLALRNLGRYGLFFLDGHADFYQPEAEPSGEVASMELALISGRGPPALADIDGLGPLTREKDIVAFGFRDEEQARGEGSQDVKSTSIWAYDLDTVRSKGVRLSANEAINRLVKRGLDGFWVHLDADVLDDRDMPAVDYRQPGGLRFDELSEILRELIATGQAVGFTVTIFNPKLDQDGVIAKRLRDCIVDGLL